MTRWLAAMVSLCVSFLGFLSQAGGLPAECEVLVGSVRLQYAMPSGGLSLRMSRNRLFDYKDGSESLDRAAYDVSWSPWTGPGLHLDVYSYRYSEPQNEVLPFDEFAALILGEYDFEDEVQGYPRGSEKAFDISGQVEEALFSGKSWLRIKSIDKANPETVFADVYILPLDREHFLAVIGSYRVGSWGDRRNRKRRMELVRGVVESVRVEPWNVSVLERD